MSLSRQFLREFRPLFRMLEEPFGRVHPSHNALAHRPTPFAALFNDPFFSRGFEMNVPAVDLSEQGNEFVVEAELPGVKKENIEIRIGDGGQSLTIEGKSFVRSPAATESPVVDAKDASGSAEGSSTITVAEATPLSQAVTQANGEQTGTQLSTERVFSSSSSFSRTVWLPHRVDGSNVKAKLEDGVLTVRIPKVEDPESVRVNIE